MTVAATSEFSAASGTSPPLAGSSHNAGEVNKAALIEEVLERVHGDNIGNLYNWGDYPDVQAKDLEAAARRVSNSEVIALMSEKLFDEGSTLSENFLGEISLDLRDEDTGQTLFMTECSRPRGTSARQEEDRAQRVNNLISREGARTNLSLQDHNGETVCTLAAKNARVEMLGVLAFLEGGSLRNAKGESPLSLLLDELFSPNFQNFPRKPNTRPLDDGLSRLINHHDFARMTETNSESFSYISSTLRTLSQDSFLYNDRDYGFMYLNTLFLFAKRNDQYQQSKIAQLEAQLAAAQARLGKEEVPALLLPPSPQS
jgi:hypothetical protein